MRELWVQEVFRPVKSQYLITDNSNKTLVNKHTFDTKHGPKSQRHTHSGYSKYNML